MKCVICMINNESMKMVKIAICVLNGQSVCLDHATDVSGDPDSAYVVIVKPS